MVNSADMPALVATRARIVLWRENRLTPHGVSTFTVSRDPVFGEKVADVEVRRCEGGHGRELDETDVRRHRKRRWCRVHDSTAKGMRETVYLDRHR